ncbi:MAG: chemotaxis protein CheX [Desulfobacteraceae bacterium]
MIKTLMHQIAISTSEVMETMFFLPVEKNGGISLEDTGLCSANETLAAGISFSGAFSGRICIFMPDSLLKMMAENLMGLNPDDVTAEDTAGTLTEALNMIAGNALRKIDDRFSSHLGLPATVDPAEVKNLENMVIFQTLGGRLALAAQIDRAPDTGRKGCF